MTPRIRLLLALTAFIAVVGLTSARRDNAVPISAASYTGTAAIEGAVALELSVSPPIGSPRDTLQLQLRIVNHMPSFASPQVELQLPATLRLGSAQVPTGVSSNVSKNSIQWLPVVPGGDVREISLPLKVSSADLTHPEQNITVQMDNGGSIQSATTTLWLGIPPRVEGIDFPAHVSVGQLLQLKAQTQGPGPFGEVWEPGDGRRVAVNEPSILYPVAGVYDVQVTVSNPIGASTFSSVITVVPHVSASVSIADESPGVGQEVAFENAGGGQGPIQYLWDFGDGTTSTEVKPLHRFATPGVYDVKLVARNAFGAAESAHTVTVGLPPEADIFVVDTAPAGTHLAGEALVVGDAPSATEYSWEMGDGRRYSSAKISHAYKQTGDYFVTLTARNEYGETQVGHWVHIEEGPRQAFMPMVSSFGGLTQGSSTDTSLVTPSGGLGPVDGDAPFVMEPLEFPASTQAIGRLLAYINLARSEFDLSELGTSATLSSAAQKHADDMAAARHNQHSGSDGSTPADRFLQFGYENGYAGEATAWGFIDPRQAVEFWVNSPSHRPIILNPFASEVGLGYTVDYTAPGVWYWTAEFGNSAGEPGAPALRVLGPSTELEVLNSQPVVFAWNWPAQLAAAEQFTVYLNSGSGPLAVGSATQPALGTQYRLTFDPSTTAEFLGEFQWRVVLENNRGAEITGSEARTLRINLDPSLPTATPVPTLQPTAVPTILPTVTPTATATTQAPAPRPTQPPLPPLVTATPLPVDP